MLLFLHKFRLNVSKAFTGQARIHSPHPLHFSGSTYLGLLVSVTTKSPGEPVNSVISAFPMISMFGCAPVPTSFGDKIHMAQSFVGKVLSNCGMIPPILGCSSTKYTLNPESARSREAWIPDMPAPSTSTAPFIPDFHLCGHKVDSHLRTLRCRRGPPSSSGSSNQKSSGLVYPAS